MNPLSGKITLHRPTLIYAHDFADILSNQQDYYLFLDIDGTLAEFTLNPKDSFIPDATLHCLQHIQNLGVPLAFVTGRSLVEARQMVLPIQAPIAASHGLEIDFSIDRTEDDHLANSQNNKILIDLNVNEVDTNALTMIKKFLIASCQPYPALSIEDKPYSCALHYRQNPDFADMAKQMMNEALAPYTHWTIKAGKCVLEAIPKGINKGTAITRLLQNTPNSERLCPIFIGDDVTDEAGFKVMQGNGIGIKVGSGSSYAKYCVNTINDVTGLLNRFIVFLKNQSQLSPQVLSGAIGSTQSSSSSFHQSLKNYP